jgi:hypothetical protein
MTKAKIPLVLCAGAALGIALMLSCGHSPQTADAADVCNCPAAEPPLDGRIVTANAGSTVPAQDLTTIVARCPTGATIVLGGSCRLATTQRGVNLQESGIHTPSDGAGWDCIWDNTTGSQVSGTATAICLKPAP